LTTTFDAVHAGSLKQDIAGPISESALGRTSRCDVSGNQRPVYIPGDDVG